jgi:hypothetical protein
MQRTFAVFALCLARPDIVLADCPSDPSLHTITDATNYDDIVVVCRRDTGSNQVYVGICTPSIRTTWVWVDVLDDYGTICEPLDIHGFSGNDSMQLMDLGPGAVIQNTGCGNITCDSGIVINWWVRFYGDAGNDALFSNNDTGLTMFVGGGGADAMSHHGSYDSNLFDGGTDPDRLIDHGGIHDDLYGQGGDDCLETHGGYGGYNTFDCGTGNDKYAYGCTPPCTPPDPSCEDDVVLCP